MSGYSDGSYAVHFAAEYDEDKCGMEPEHACKWCHASLTDAEWKRGFWECNLCYDQQSGSEE